MYEVRPGHVVRVRREGLTERRYWALEAREHTDDLDTTVRRVRELLDDIVDRQLIADVPLCTLLSGGLDSSVITALAARRLGAAGKGPVRSFAVDFVGQTENFRADALRATPDGPYAHALAEHAGSDHQDIVLDTAALMDDAEPRTRCSPRAICRRLRRERHLALPAVQGDPQALDGRPVRRVGGRGVRRLPLVPRRGRGVGRTPSLDQLARHGRLRRAGNGRQHAGCSTAMSCKRIDIDGLPGRPLPRGARRSAAPAGRDRGWSTGCGRSRYLHLTRFVRIPARPQGPREHGGRAWRCACRSATTGWWSTSSTPPGR